MILCMVKSRIIALKHFNCVSFLKIAYLDNTLYLREERERERERVDKE